MDTGIIENEIISKLDSGVRQGYKIAKYLIQLPYGSCHAYIQPSICSADKLDQSLYGYEPMMKSYHLRCLLLHLLIHTHDTPFASQLTGGTLALCLLDMASKCAVKDVVVAIPLTNIFDVYMATGHNLSMHPLIQILLDSNMDDIDKFELLNTGGVPRFPEGCWPEKNPIPDNHIQNFHYESSEHREFRMELE